MTKEEILKQFYLAYWLWLCAGAPDTYNEAVGFTRDTGLCSNLIGFARTRIGCDYYEADAALVLMISQWVAAGLDKESPFNQGGFSYWSERGKMHRNPFRTTWVKDHVEEI